MLANTMLNVLPYSALIINGRTAFVKSVYDKLLDGPKFSLHRSSTVAISERMNTMAAEKAIVAMSMTLSNTLKGRATPAIEGSLECETWEHTC